MIIITKNKENETENDYLALGVTLLGCIVFLNCNNGFSCCTNDAKCVNANNADSIQVEMMVHQIWYDLNAKIGNGDTCSFTPYQKQVYEVSYVKMAKKAKKVEGKKQLYLDMTKDEYMKLGLHEAFYNAKVKDLEDVNHYFDSIPNDTAMWNGYVKLYDLKE